MNARRSLAATLLAATLPLTVLAHARAAHAAVPIEIVPRGQNRILIDGALGDWRRFTQLSPVDDPTEVVTGRERWTGVDDGSFSYALARDDQTLYFVADVRDDVLVRSAEHRETDDALLVALAVPGANGRLTAYELVVYPGDSGRFPGQVRFRGTRSGPVPGAQMTELVRGARGAGFVVEVSIPLSSIPEIGANFGAVRGRVAYQDEDDVAAQGASSVLATGPGNARAAAELPAALPPGTRGVDAQLAHFRNAYNLAGTDPLLDRTANVAGDSAIERVVVFPRYAFLAGPGVADGRRYAFFEHPATAAGDVIESLLRDVTGDGRQDLVLRTLRVEGRIARQMLQVYASPNGRYFRRIFAHELGRTQGRNAVLNRATYEGGGRIRVTFNSNNGYTQRTFAARATPEGALAPLTPWSPNRVVVYRWNDTAGAYEPERTEPNAGAAGANGPVIAEQRSPTMSEFPGIDAVMARFRRQNSIPDGMRPSFSATGDVAGDSTPESVQVFGRYLLVTGPGFMNGRSFYSVELPVTNDADVLSLQLADVTGDGRAEAVVRTRRTTQQQVRGRTLDVVREYLTIYSIDDAHRGRVFAAEVARRVGGDAVTNVVRPLPAGRNDSVVIEAGAAAGAWNAQSYPFHDAPVQGVTGILLPWEPARRVVYRWNGTTLTAGR